MKKIYCLLLTALCLLFATPALAQKGTPDPIVVGTDLAASPTDLEPILSKDLAAIADYQNQFSSGKSGKYAQVLPLFSTAPSDGVATLPDLKDSKPTSGVTGTDLLNALGQSAYPMSLAINVYDGPKGTGYEVVALAKFNGQLWQRVVNVGPEEYRESDWAIVP